MKTLIAAFGLLFMMGCTGSTEKQTTTTQPAHNNNLALPSPDWVKERVEQASDRLNQTEAGQIVWKSINYHGGLRAWYNNGPLYFRFNYRPVDPELKIRDTYQTVDTWSAVARHQLAENPEIEYGWDGQRAWKFPADADLAINPRFWSLSPYYFVGLPFVLSDQGITLTQEESEIYEGEEHLIVRATFGDNVGDASDFYVLYINASTYRLAAIRYIVSFKGFFPDGGHTPEKLMTYEGSQIVNGIRFPSLHRTFMWSDQGRGAHVTNTTVTDVAFRINTPKSYFEVPEGAYVMTGYME